LATNNNNNLNHKKKKLHLSVSLLKCSLPFLSLLLSLLHLVVATSLTSASNEHGDNLIYRGTCLPREQEINKKAKPGHCSYSIDALQNRKPMQGIMDVIQDMSMFRDAPNEVGSRDRLLA